MICIPHPIFGRVTKSRRKWAKHVARMGERRGVCSVVVGKLEGKNHLGEAGLDGRIIIRCIFRKYDVGLWTGKNWLRIVTGGGHM